MGGLMKQVIGEKKEWRSMEARAHALPRDYQIVYGAMKRHLRRSTYGDGTAAMVVLQDVLDRFEAGAGQRNQVLDVTGDDVAAFCDERVRDLPSYADSWRATLNSDVHKKLRLARSPS